MAEKQQDLGKTSENHQERQPHVCPACEREFKEIQDYPKVFVASVSVVSPDDVLAELPHWRDERVSTSSQSGGRGAVVPEEVVAYFRENPDVEKMVYGDSYIYKRPYIETQAYRDAVARNPERYANTRMVGGDEYTRKYNHAPAMRALLEQNDPLREYLASLQQMAGQEVPTRELFPKWQQHYFPSVFHVPSGLGVSNADRFLLRFSESDDRPTEYRVAEVGIWGDGPNMGSAGGPTIQRLLPVGALNYEGRVNRT